MAFQPHRLHRALRRSYSLIEHSLHGHKATSVPSISAPRISPTPAAATAQLVRRSFTSTTALFRREFNPETDEIGPNTILFEGCDYNHWLITVDFPKDSNITREQMVETYVNIAAKIFGSVEEAKKKIYALSTTTYQGFQVECSEDVSEKFKEIPEVVFVLPDSYIDPINKEYGGDKYVNGDIFPRPPPVHYGRRNNNRGPPRDQNYLSPREQNYGPPREQNYGPPSQQNNRPPPQQNYGQPPQQNYGQPPEQNYGQPPQQNYGPTSQQHSNRPPQQGFTPQPHQSYGPPAQQSYGPNAQGSYGNSPNFPPHSNNSPAGPGGRSGYMPPNNTSSHDQRNSAPSYQGNFNRAEFETHSAQPGQRGFSQDVNYGSSQDGAFGQASGGHRNFSSSGDN